VCSSDLLIRGSIPSYNGALVEILKPTKHEKK
jgi:hypothetical protein